jgi:hypothetical protein
MPSCRPLLRLIAEQGHRCEHTQVSLFRRRAKEPAASGPDPAEMRGKAAEISDAGVLGWEVVWEALKTEPPADDGTLTQELGLGEEHEISQDTSDMPATEFSGTRNGRRVALRIGVVPSIWRERAANEVEVEAAVTPFRVEADGGRLGADAAAPPEVGELLAGLAPSDAWKQCEIEGGPDGILARRPVTAHPQGYVYDLWLVERLAERLGA